MTNVEPVVRRVLRRFLRASPEPETNVEDSYTITTAVTLGEVLEPEYGPLYKVWFTQSSNVGSSFPWQAVSLRGQLITGRIVVHSSTRRSPTTAASCCPPR